MSLRFEPKIIWQAFRINWLFPSICLILDFILTWNYFYVFVGGVLRQVSPTISYMIFYKYTMILVKLTICFSRSWLQSSFLCPTFVGCNLWTCPLSDGHSGCDSCAPSTSTIETGISYLLDLSPSSLPADKLACRRQRYEWMSRSLEEAA